MVAPTTSSGKQSILPLFPLLASHDETTRLDASYTLLNSLPLPTPPKNDADTPYAIKRLVAGLASSNESARQGFAVALAQLVETLPDEIAKDVLPAYDDATTSRAGMDAREERDLLFAKLVGAHALVRSGVLVRPTGEASNAGESWKEVVQQLVALANKKSWIREPSYWVICEAIEALATAPASEWKDDAIKWAVQRLVNDAREKAKGWGPDKIAVVLTLQAHGIVRRSPSFFSALCEMTDGGFSSFLTGLRLQIDPVSDVPFWVTPRSLFPPIACAGTPRRSPICVKPFRDVKFEQQDTAPRFERGQDVQECRCARAGTESPLCVEHDPRELPPARRSRESRETNWGPSELGRLLEGLRRW